MERGSDKHGFRLDDAMASEVDGMMRAERDTRPESFRSMEPSGEDQPDVDRAPNETMQGALPDGLTRRDVELRSELATFLPPSTFPAVQTVLLEAAERNEAPDHLLDLLRRVPSGREYANVGEAYEASGGGREEHRF